MLPTGWSPSHRARPPPMSGSVIAPLRARMRPLIPPLGARGGDLSVVTRDDARPLSMYLYLLRNGVIHPRDSSHERTRASPSPCYLSLCKTFNQKAFNAPRSQRDSFRSATRECQDRADDERGCGASRRGNRRQRCLDTLERPSDKNNTLARSRVARLPFDTTGAFATCKLLLDSTRYRGAIKRFRPITPPLVCLARVCISGYIGCRESRCYFPALIRSRAAHDEKRRRKRKLGIR